MSEDKKRVYMLDILRFSAALMVVLYHYTVFLPTKTSDFDIYQAFFSYGYLGVNLFFMISGFVIFLSVDGKSWSEFIASRISRLFPAYWFSVLLTFLMISLYAQHIGFTLSIYELLINFTMLQDFLNVRHVDGVYWTLTIELIFYFWVFVFIIFNRLEILPYLTVLLSVLYLGGAYNSILEKVFIMNWMPFFSSGIVFYLLLKNNKKKEVILHISIFVNFLAALKSTYNHSGYLSEIGVSVQDSMLFIITLLFFLCFYIMLNLPKSIDGKFNNKLIFTLGAITYPLYLLHQNVGYILFSLFREYNPHFILCVILGVMVFISFNVNFYIEKKYSKKVYAFCSSMLIRRGSKEVK
ncbi:acyltransferase [Vibrio parahaemolyticus]|nr:acyltransferase family protein [Vibrio parahaemolyticus]EGQ8821006.1 acyltransferase family protein [Vibrio parahaemolyticus]EGQ8895624.1 acyltransferase family protein [Vibrio parahaemolyticus]EJC7120637.1 acyltransferase [Vibrio parahaemolyticus]EJG0565963.1 acyltransferase [Vibrio parahaemolyticus]